MSSTSGFGQFHQRNYGGINYTHDKYLLNGTSLSTGQTVNGTVVDQNGNPCVNCTVVGWGVDYDNISASKAQSLEDRANELVQEASTVQPGAFNPDLQLTGAGGTFQSASEPYVAVHTQADWEISTPRDSTPESATPELAQPDVRLPPNELLIFSAWNPNNDPLFEDTTDADSHGATIPENQTIVIEQVGPANSTIEEPLELETKPVVEYGIGGAGGKTHYAAAAELPTGFYRVSVQNSSVSYVIAVGDTEQMVSAIRDDLNKSATQYSNRAQDVRDKLNKGKLTKYRTTTDANGSFNFSVGSNVNTVAVQAYKRPPGMSTSPENVTMDDINTYYATTDYNGSVVLPQDVKTVDAPSSNNTVRVREHSSPSFPDLQNHLNRTELFEQFLKNLSYSDLPPALQQRLNGTSREKLQQLSNELAKLTDENEQLRKRVEELSSSENISDPSQLNLTALRALIQAQQQALAEQPNTVPAGETTSNTGTDTISARFPFDTNLDPEQVVVRANYPNGTTQVLNTSSDYVSVESNVGDDAVVITEFPVSSSDPGSVTFDVTVATAEGVGSASQTIDNPAKAGSPPSIAGISFSTLHPGPDEAVSMTIDGGEETTITNLTTATVYGPDGTQLSTTTTGGDTLEFTTNGTGIHYIEATFETADGKTATVTQRVKAGDVPREMPAGVRVTESPLGTYAVVGDGLEAGTVSIEGSGSSVTVLAQVNQSEDIPTKLHVYTSELSLPPESTITVRVVQGDDQQAVSQHVQVAVHLAALDTAAATLYANGEPLPREGSNANGEVTTTASGTTIQTMSTDEGVVEITANADPGLIESQVYAIELSTGIDVPGLAMVPTWPGLPGWAPPTASAIGVVAVPVAARRATR